jgi:hypothetical protein
MLYRRQPFDKPCPVAPNFGVSKLAWHAYCLACNAWDKACACWELEEDGRKAHHAKVEKRQGLSTACKSHPPMLNPKASKEEEPTLVKSGNEESEPEPPTCKGKGCAKATKTAGQLCATLAPKAKPKAHGDAIAITHKRLATESVGDANGEPQPKRHASKHKVIVVNNDKNNNLVVLVHPAPLQLGSC